MLGRGSARTGISSNTRPPHLTTSLKIALMDRKPRQSRGKALDNEYQRTYKACIPCARRKVKCEAGDEKCRRCIKNDIDCTYDSKKPWSRDQNNRINTPLRRLEGNRYGSRCVWDGAGVF